MKNIIFDWSGVIKDAFEAHLWVVNRIFKKYGLKELTYDELKNNWEEPYMLFFNKYLPKMTLEEEQANYKEGISDKDYPKSKSFPGVVELIKNLKANGDYIGMITSDLSESIFSEIKQFGLGNVFNDVITKVHDKTEAVGNLIKKNGFSLNETFIVGDSNNEITAARNLGIKSVAVTWGIATEKRLIEAKPDFLVHNIKELEQAINN